MDGVKWCSKCGEAKELRCFYRRVAAADGVQPHCKHCQKEMQAERSRTEKYRAATKRWRTAHPGAATKYQRDWYQKAKAELRPSYAAALLRMELPKGAKVSRSLAEAKAAHMELKQLIKERAYG